MVWIRCFAILWLLLLVTAKQEDILTQHLRKANEYVLAHTRYRTHRLPKVVWLSSAEMAKAGADDDEVCPDNSGEVIDAREADGIMYLTKDKFEPGRDDQIIVHELVHFQQETNPNVSHNLGILEKEAYGIEAQYVKDTHKGELPDPQMVATISQQDCTV